MSLAEGHPDNAVAFRLSYDTMGPQAPRAMKQPSLFSYEKHHPLILGGSPVLAWRRQHRRSVRSVPRTQILPPLERCGQDYSGDAWTTTPFGSPQCLRKARHSSMPPGASKLLWGGVQQGPSLRPLLASPSSLRLRKEQFSAMALDLMSDKDTTKPELCQAGADVDTTSDATSDLKVNEEVEEFLLLPAPEGPMEQHWFSFGELEAQVRNLRQQEPAPKAASGLNVQEEFFAAANDHEEIGCVSYAPSRVRPGEFLVFDQKQQLEFDIENFEDMETDIADEEDIGTLTAEYAVDSGLKQFMVEVLGDGDWEEEEEV